MEGPFLDSKPNALLIVDFEAVNCLLHETDFASCQSIACVRGLRSQGRQLEFRGRDFAHTDSECFLFGLSQRWCSFLAQTTSWEALADRWLWDDLRLRRQSWTKAAQFYLLFTNPYSVNSNLDCCLHFGNFGGQIYLQLAPTSRLLLLTDLVTLKCSWHPSPYYCLDCLGFGWSNSPSHCDGAHYSPTNFCFARLALLCRLSYVECCSCALMSFKLSCDPRQRRACVSLARLFRDFIRAIASIHFTIDRDFWACLFRLSSKLDLALQQLPTHPFSPFQLSIQAFCTNLSRLYYYLTHRNFAVLQSSAHYSRFWLPRYHQVQKGLPPSSKHYLSHFNFHLQTHLHHFKKNVTQYSYYWVDSSYCDDFECDLARRLLYQEQNARFGPYLHELGFVGVLGVKFGGVNSGFHATGGVGVSLPD